MPPGPGHVHSGGSQEGLLDGEPHVSGMRHGNPMWYQDGPAGGDNNVISGDCCERRETHTQPDSGLKAFILVVFSPSHIFQALQGGPDQEYYEDLILTYTV